MKRSLKEGIISVAVVAVIGIILGLAVFQMANAVSVLNTSVTTNSVASSTPVQLGFFTANTNTVMFDTNGVDAVDLNIQMTGSTTGAVLNWVYEFSDDNIDWFGEDIAQVTSAIAVAHSSTTITHSWTPNTTSTVRKNIGIAPIGSRYMRIRFSAGVATSTVWARLALKRDLAK